MLYKESGKENGNPIGIMGKKMETTVLYRVRYGQYRSHILYYIILYRAYIRVL